MCYLCDYLKKFYYVINKKYGFLLILRDVIIMLYLFNIINNIKLIYVFE